MPKKYLKRYQELATTRGHGDPLEYVFNRVKVLKAQGKHKEATALALTLIPYGHGKVAQVDQETGETVQNAVFKLD